jgi:hypothetical protein
MLASISSVYIHMPPFACSRITLTLTAVIAVSKNSGATATAARAAVVLGGLMLPAALGACAGDRGAGSAGSTVPAASDKADVVGGGGHLDEIYRQIYSPGNPAWSDF